MEKNIYNISVGEDNRYIVTEYSILGITRDNEHLIIQSEDNFPRVEKSTDVMKCIDYENSKNLSGYYYIAPDKDKIEEINSERYRIYLTTKLQSLDYREKLLNSDLTAVRSQKSYIQQQLENLFLK